jgi:hypothetical protein
MFANRLVQLIEDHADKLAEGLLYKLQHEQRCQNFVGKVPVLELKTRTYEIYRHLGEWLLNKTESEIEERFVGIGIRRAHQGIAYCDLFWAFMVTKDYLWEYLEREGLLEQPVELFGELDLLHHLDRFFDRALYFAAVGYEKVRKQADAEVAAALAVGR